MSEQIDASAEQRSRCIAKSRRYFLATSIVRTIGTLVIVWGVWLLGPRGLPIITCGVTFLVIMINGVVLIRNLRQAPRLMREATRPLALTHV